MVTAFTSNPGTDQSTIASAATELGRALPSDYQELLQTMNGGEGLIGDIFFRLYSIQQVLCIQKTLAVEGLVADIRIIGSNGGGEAYALDYQEQGMPLIKVPFIPLDLKYAIPCGVSISVFLLECIDEAMSDQPKPSLISTILKRQVASPSPIRPGNPQITGKEIHEIHPIIFGDSPTDKANKAFMPLEDYLKMVVFWNAQYRKIVGNRA